MNETDPHPTGLPARATSTLGFILLVYEDNEQPVLLRRPRGGEWLLPVFSTNAKLEEALAWMQIFGRWKPKRITDHKEFIDSMRVYFPEIQVAGDPYLHNGNTRWTRFFPDRAANN